MKATEVEIGGFIVDCAQVGISVNRALELKRLRELPNFGYRETIDRVWADLSRNQKTPKETQDIYNARLEDSYHRGYESAPGIRNK